MDSKPSSPHLPTKENPTTKTKESKRLKKS